MLLLPRPNSFNGSTDLSRTIAETHGARVVVVKEPGYGNALMGGIAAARGRFVIIGDADASYDFLEIPKIVEKLRADFDQSRVAGFQLEGVRFGPARCHFYIGGSEPPFFRFSSGNGSGPR